MKPIGRSSGFTLTELMVVLVVIAILTALAAPSFVNLIEKRRLIGAGEEIFGQLMFARNEAVKRSKPIYLTFTADGGTTWAFGITDREGGCNTATQTVTDDDSCSIDYDNDATTDDRVLYLFGSDDFSNVSLDSPVFGALPQGCSDTDLDTNESCFDAARGTARGTWLPSDTDNAIVLSTDQYELHIQINVIGRSLLCSPAGAKVIPDYPEC